MQDQLFFTDRQWSIVNGSLLGDGYISKIRCGKSYFCKPQCIAHKEYLQWHFEELLPYSSSLKDYDNKCLGKIFKRATFRTKSYEKIAYLRQLWYPNDKKIVPSGLTLCPLSIAVWFFDDGSNDVRHRIAKFATYGFQKEECNFLRELLLGFNIKTSLVKRNVITVRTESYKTLVDLVSPFMLWDCFKHKVQYRDAEFTVVSESEKKVIFEMHRQGKNGITIAKAISRSPSAISTAMRSMGLSPVVGNKSGIKGITWDTFTCKWRVHQKSRFSTLDEAKKALTKGH